MAREAVEKEVAEERAYQATVLQREAEKAAANAKEGERRAHAVALQKQSEWLTAQERDAIRQVSAGKCNSHLEFLAGCVMATAPPWKEQALQAGERLTPGARDKHPQQGHYPERLHPPRPFAEQRPSPRALKHDERASRR